MKLETLIEEAIYDNGIQRKDSVFMASNIMAIVRNFMYTNYIKGCEEHNGSSYCKNCGLSLDELI